MNYSTEIILNPIYQNSDFEVNPINLDIGLDLGVIDFAIDILLGSNIIIGGSTGGHDIKYQGSILPTKSILEFTGNVNVSDGPTSTVVNVPLQIIPDSSLVTYQSTPPINPRLNDIWVSTISLIQYQWIGSWVNFNLQSLVNYVIIDTTPDGGNSTSIIGYTIDGGNSLSIYSDILDGGNAGVLMAIIPDGGNSIFTLTGTIDGGTSLSVIDNEINGGDSI